MKKGENYKLEKSKGGIIQSSAGCLIFQNNIFILAIGSILKAISITTGQRIFTLRGHTRNITGIFTDPTDLNLVISTSIVGAIKFWNLKTKSCIKTFKLGDSSRIISAAINADGFLFALSKIPAPEKSQYYEILVVNITQECHINKRINLNECITRTSRVYIGNQDKTLVGIGGHKLWIIDLTTSKVHYLNNESSLFAVAVHPLQSIIATGDQVGKIVIYTYPGGDFGCMPIKQYLHWHAHSVLSLSFTTNNMLLSGGLEGVLVIWNLMQEGKYFVPRLGGPIERVECMELGAIYTVFLSSNQCKLIRASNYTLIQEVRGISYPETFKSGSKKSLRNTEAQAFPFGIKQDPMTRDIILNNNNGWIERIVESGECINIPGGISEEPYNPNTNQENKGYISHLCMKENNPLIITIHYTPPHTINSQILSSQRTTLTIYKTSKSVNYNNHTQNNLNNKLSGIATLHSKLKIKDIKWIVNSRFVTIDDQNKYKIWGIRDIYIDNQQKEILECLIEGEYKNLPLMQIEFIMPHNGIGIYNNQSLQGGMCILVEGGILPIWDIRSFVLSTVLNLDPTYSHPTATNICAENVITKIGVATQENTGDVYILCLTTGSLFCWDYVGRKLLWKQDIVVADIALNMSKGQEVAVCLNGEGDRNQPMDTIAIFQVQTGQPIFLHKFNYSSIISIQYVLSHKHNDEEEVLILNSRLELQTVSNCNLKEKYIEDEEEIGIRGNDHRINNKAYKYSILQSLEERVGSNMKNSSQGIWNNQKVRLGIFGMEERKMEWDLIHKPKIYSLPSLTAMGDLLIDKYLIPIEDINQANHQIPNEGIADIYINEQRPMEDDINGTVMSDSMDYESLFANMKL